MSIKRITLFLLAITYLSIYVAPVNAQTETPQAESFTGEVSGRLVNKSPDGGIPENVDLMLHIWDQNYNGLGMLHGQSSPDGSFVFPDVEFDPALIYAVMANYDGATYFSETKAPAQGDSSLEFEVPIYDTSPQLSQVSIDQAHVLFSFGQSSLEVLEVYFLSNLGKYTIKDAVTLENGQTATLRFRMPEDAYEISYKDNENGRFIQLLGGFADTSPLVPGRGSAQIVLRYLLPYENQYNFTFQPPVPVENIDFLVVQDESITVQGDGLTLEGPQTVQDGTTFDVYSHVSLQADAEVEISLSGEPANVSSPDMVTNELGETAKTSFNLEIGLGALALGLALVGAGVWWWRKPGDEDELDGLLEQADYRDLVAQIVELDETYQAGEIPEDEYRRRRQSFIDEGKALLIEEEE